SRPAIDSSIANFSSISLMATDYALMTDMLRPIDFPDTRQEARLQVSRAGRAPTEIGNDPGGLDAFGGKVGAPGARRQAMPSLRQTRRNHMEPLCGSARRLLNEPPDQGAKGRDDCKTGLRSLPQDSGGDRRRPLSARGARGERMG